ncbi:MAG: TonB-dependent receptor [Steroidobacteraceae bacterium]
MSTSNSVQRAVRLALMTGAAASAVITLPAWAADDTISEVVVTGSRIAQPNMTSISPVTSVSAEALKVQGVTRVEDLINSLPQAFGDFGGNLSNGSTGASTVNLRNLGSQRTLVLINSRRLMPGDPTQNGAASPDLNQIPAALVERVEVLTGGASAVYGADAVGGVVNFIMNDKFEGLRFDGQYSFYQHKNDSDIGKLVRSRNFSVPDSNVTDGYGRDMSFIAGINTPDGKGNATAYISYLELDPITQDQRDFSACALGSSAAGGTGSAFTCGGSGTPAITRFLPQAGGDFTIGAGNALRPFTSADQYNFAPSNYYQRPDERKSAGVFAHYDFSEKASVYTEFMFMDDRTLAQIAPSGAFLGGGPGAPPFFGNNAINCNNPFLSPSMVTTFCGGNVNAPDVFINIGKRNVEGGNRIDDLRHTSYRGVLGVKGDFADGWNYDVYGLYGTSLLSENYQNDFSRTRLAKALNAVTPAGGGSPVCRVNADADLSNDDPACVPYNIYQLGGVTPQALAYLQVPGLTSGSTTETIVSGSISGDLGAYGLKFPTATDGIAIAFGAEYRSEESELKADSAFQTNDLAGQGAPTLNTTGSFDVKELFTEVRVPILQDKPFAKTMSFEAGYRFSDYNLGFDTDSYKLGLDWAPIDDIRLRGSYQRAVRSPNIQELFLQQRVQLDGATDPCASDGVDAPERSAAECARTGVTAAQYGNILANPAGQYNGLVGGNADLDPEVSDTYSFGFVLTPAFLENFTVAVDYYDIKVEKIIDSLGADFALGQCLDTGDSFYCGLVNRSPGNGSLWLGDGGFVTDPIINKGSLQTKGVDAEVNYRFEMGGLGQMALNLIGTYTDEYLTEPLPGTPKYDCAGLYGTVCLQPIPDWRHKLRASWTSPWNVDLSLTWRYIAEVDIDASSSDPSLSGAIRRSDAKLGSRSYFDLAGSYTWNGVTGRLGVNNVLDKDPPLVGQQSIPSVVGNGNTFPQVYDALGRYVFVGLTADF